MEGIFRLPNLKYTSFLQDELVAVVHAHTKLDIQDEITPEDLPNIPLVLRERGSGTLDVFERALSQHNLKLSSLNVMMYLGRKALNFSSNILIVWGLSLSVPYIKNSLQVICV